MPIEVGCNRNVETKNTVDIRPNNYLGCIAQQVHRIDQAQKEAILEESCLTCSSPRLGDNVINNNIFNTRPFSLYLQNGRLFSILINDPTQPSTILETPVQEIETETINSLDEFSNNLSRPTSNRPSGNRSNNINSSNNLPPSPSSTNLPPRNDERSSIFRVECVEGNCATLRALVVRRGSEGTLSSNPRRQRRLLATCFCCTVDLNDFVCIQCFEDTYVPNLEVCID